MATIIKIISVDPFTRIVEFSNGSCDTQKLVWIDDCISRYRGLKPAPGWVRACVEKCYQPVPQWYIDTHGL